MKDIAKDLGTEQLCARLSRILVARIQKELPTIAGQIHRLIAAKKKELREMGGRPSRGGMGYRGLPLFTLGGEHA